MGYLKIYCDTCGGKWEVYPRDMNNLNSNQCPHCFTEIDKQTWKRQILPAFGEMLDSEKELIKDHADSNGLFTVSFKSDPVKKEAGSYDTSTEQLQGFLQELIDYDIDL